MSTKKPDFSNVRSTASSTQAPRADFSQVRSQVTSTEEPLDNGGEPEQVHTVAKGETLSHIAKQYYGRASQWPRIFEANRDQLDNPDRISIGQVLKIPPVQNEAE